MEVVRNLRDLNKRDTVLAGGKGASLGEMTQAGIPVPPGFVVLSNAFDAFLEGPDLNVEIASVLRTVDHKELYAVEEASAKIQSLILGADFPKDIADEVQRSFRGLNADLVAVRSSATAEDGAAAAWAGQLESFLNTTDKMLLENIKKCWASLFTPRAVFYRFERGIQEDISVAVVVQKMVDSDISGVAFSVHPVTQDQNQVIIEAGFGLGEAIVSGRITPDRYVVEKKEWLILETNIVKQEKMLVKRPCGGTEWADVPDGKQSIQKLSGRQIMALARMVLDIEAQYGHPCDIEWALERSAFYITQSRPITTLI
jgi:pyruvate,water dikinase